MCGILLQRTLRQIVLVSMAFHLTAVQAQSLTYLVGADASICDFDDIQQAINAAQAHAGPDSIRIAADKVYSGLALKVGGQELTIEGGYATCADALVALAPPAGRTVLSGFGAPADSVIEFNGSGVHVLRGLQITRGDDPTSGGGIQFDGAGDMRLENVHVVNNDSSYGGGINFHGRSSDVAFLVLGEDVIVRGNVASQSGGGIRLTGNGRLDMVEDRTAVFGNQALGASSDQLGHGGGVLIVGPAQASIGSSGIEGATIFDNHAKHGGGLAVIAPEQDASVLLFSVDSARLFGIAANVASVQGGGIYLGGRDASFAHVGSTACIGAYEIRIDDNRSPIGAALYANQESSFRLNAVGGSSLYPCRFVEHPPAAAVSCAAGSSPECSQIRSNRSEDGAGRLTSGAVVAAREHDRSRVSLERVALVDNAGGRLLHSADCSGCLMTRNALIDSVAAFPHYQAVGRGFSLSNTTIADNGIGGAHVLRVGGSLRLENSIVDQPGWTLLLRDGGDARIDADGLLTTGCTPAECSGFINLVASSAGPRFLDRDRIDYRLHAASPAIDAAVPVDGDDYDLDGNLRDIAVNPLRGPIGVRDLGAYERQSLEPLVPNGDFVGDIHPWQPLASATARLIDAGILGNPGGAGLVADKGNRRANEARMVQCVPLPVPGVYRLTGFAAGQGFSNIHRDEVRIRWRYFAQTTSNRCTGTPTQFGEVLFPNRQQLSAPLADAFITVLASEFNELSQMEIELVAIERNSIAVNDSTAGMFDGIRLIPPRL